MIKRHRVENIIFFVVLLFMLSTLVLYGYLGTFTRYMADDYYTAAALKENGFLGTQSFWWQHWSGRYSFTFLVSFVELFGIKGVPILPIFVIFAWVFGFVWGGLPLLRNIRVRHPASFGIFISSVVLWVTYRIIDDYPQVVFWQTGILTYPVSPILFLVGVGMAARRLSVKGPVRWLEVIFWFLYAFVAGGFSETGVVVQIAMLFILLILTFAFAGMEKRKFLRSILVPSLLGSFVSLIVIAVAPGNIVRSGGFRDLLSLNEFISGSLLETLMVIPRLADGNTLPLLFGFSAGMFIALFKVPVITRINTLMLLKLLGLSLLMGLTGVWAGIAPAYILRGALPPERVLLFSYFLVVCLVVFWGGILAVWLRSLVSGTQLVLFEFVTLCFLLVFTKLAVVPFFTSQLHLIEPLKEYSMRWDDRHQHLISAKSNGETTVVVTDFMKIDGLRKLRSKLWLTGDLETSPSYWINQGAAQFYGVTQIIAE